jgi:hypothetical protein
LLIVDSDTFRVFGASGLLGELVACFGLEPTALRRLPAIQYQIKRGAFVRGLSAECLASLEEAVAATPPLTAEPSAGIEALIGLPGVDVGESLLYATLSTSEDIVLVSGDKRALRTVATEPSLEKFEARSGAES